MQTFISETIKDILKTNQSFEDVVFVMPSQRSGFFVKQCLKDEISVGFLPEIVNIEEFVSWVSEIKKVDFIQLLFNFYSVYKEVESNPDSFDVFSSWALIVLQDFNEIDQHLVDTKDIFIYLRDIKRLQEWSVKGTFKETELIKSHNSFTKKLNEYYNLFYKFLLDKGVGYQGVLYREAVNKIGNFLEKNSNKKFYFIGFNALNKSEEFLFQKLLNENRAEVYWDIDEMFLKNNHQVGNFIKKYKKEWKYYENNELKSVGNWFEQDKNIEVIGASKNITQIKYGCEILSKLQNHENTALVLADESLLPITLNSLPENVKDVNITMGYPLKNIPETNLFFSIFQLFISQEKLQKTEENLFYHKDVVKFLKQSSIYRLLNGISDEITLKISEDNNMFISQSYLSGYLGKLSKKERDIISSIFSKYTSIDEFLLRVINLINLLKEGANELEKEYLFRFNNIFTQLQNLHLTFGYLTDLKVLYKFFKQLISSESLSFQGEPLQGLQLMGMLETRVLDFKNVIITSVNEGVLPANSQQTSFIPFDVKVAFGLPTYREKDSIFAYHFFRLIQRAENIYLIYNTEHDSFGNGEKSRFIMQLELLKNGIISKNINPKVITKNTELQKIQKNEQVLQELKKLAEKGISPSALTNYLYNPVEFYKQKVLNIKEFKDVEEEVAFNTLGNVVHKTLEELYEPFVKSGQFLKISDILEMQKKVRSLVENHFKNLFKGDVSTGKNKLILEVAIRFVENFLQKEKELLSDENNQLKIIATEENLSSEINIEGIEFPIKLHGNVDRIDELNGVIRIIDYKTGLVNSTDLKITDFDNIIDYKYSKSIQVLLYAYMFVNSEYYDANKTLQAGVFSFKNLNSGFLKLNFSSNYKTPDNLVTEEKICEFMEQMKILIKDIFNINKSFEEPKELSF